MNLDFNALGERINAVDFDHPFKIVDGEVLDAPGVWAPEVYHDETDDVEIHGEGWTPLTGMTGQYGYHGAVMHASEYIGSGIAQTLAEDYAPGTVFVVVVVEVLPDDDDPEPEPAGWALLALTDD